MPGNACQATHAMPCLVNFSWAHVELDAVPPGKTLEDGWRVEKRQRSGGTTAGQWDAVRQHHACCHRIMAALGLRIRHGRDLRMC